MKTLTIRDFRTRPRQAREELARAGEAVLTLNGEPVAVMLAVEDGLEEAVELIERVRAQKAVREIRAAARKSGADRLSAAAVGRMVGDVRRARARRRRAS
ncbi:MAG: type II toxin-antitoxin system Phd/YefM family antitoxin [Candidatus Binatia bacterium]